MIQFGSQWLLRGSGNAIGRPRNRRGRRVIIRLPIAEDDFADCGLGRRESEVSGRTRDQFLPYRVSPEHVLCTPVVSPVTMELPVTPSFPSPGSPVAMDRILARDVDLLMDNESDLPSLPSSLLPVMSPRVLPSKPPVVPSAGGLPDLSREGPFDVSQDSSVSGATPWVMDNLPGCQYRTTMYEDTQAMTADPGYGLQLQNPRFLEYVGTPESA